MSLRPPQSLSSSFRLETGASVLEAEILVERAAALGRAGDKVAQALTALRAGPGGETELRDAAEAVWSYFVVRELSGFLDHADAVREYDIPKAVLARLGAR